MVYLVTGACGSGKTWIMKGLIEMFDVRTEAQSGLYRYLENENIIIIGKYNDEIFAGSDKLSMSVMADNAKFKEIIKDKIVICEGDRFTNNTFIKEFNPVILRLLDNGESGRDKRGSSQTERHIKSMQTRVNNIKPHFVFTDSTQCLDFLENQLRFKLKNKPLQINLF